MTVKRLKKKILKELDKCDDEWEGCMAFIDKCTHMMRCAIIDNSIGNILYEGVWIEGKFLLKEVLDDGVYVIDEKDIYDHFYLGDNWEHHNHLLVWQDDKADMWVPVENKELRFDGQRYWNVEDVDE